MRRVLVIDPDDSRRHRLRADLDGEADCEIIEASETKDIRDAVAAGLSAIVADAGSFDESTELAAIAKTVPVVLVAVAPNIRQAVASMRAGASDYLTHPLEAGALATALKRIADSAPAAARSSEFSPLIGHCPAMRELFDRIKAVAASDSTVLIQGESGTGKELVAHALHANGARRDAQMISLNCSAVPPRLLSRELFGSASAGVVSTVRGLVAAADGGTLFLDAVGDLPADAQQHLLTFLRHGGIGERRFNVRLLAATHHDLKQLTDNGHFRQDLFLLLNAVALRVPPLRDRGEDVLAIANDILERTAIKLNKRGLSFAADATCAMRRYPWPGNVRELENAVERAVILCQGATIDASQLAIDVGRELPPSLAAATPPEAPAAIDGEIDSGDAGALERFFLRFVLENQDQLTETELAERLGISRKSLWERRQRLDIPRRRTRKRGPRRDDA